MKSQWLVSRGGWRFLPQWEADLRYDYLDFMTQNLANERVLDTTTLGFSISSTRAPEPYSTTNGAA